LDNFDYFTRRLPFIHWFDWGEPNTTEDLSVVTRDMDVTRRMIANPPFKNISAATNPALLFNTVRSNNLLSISKRWWRQDASLAMMSPFRHFAFAC